MPTTWDDSAKFRLLLAVIDSMDVKTPPWDAVAKKMGSDYTAEAVRQQYQKIKKGAAAQLNATDNDGEPATLKPRKRGTGAPKTPKTKTPAKRKAPSSDDDDDGQDDESAVKKKSTPSRKSKTAAPKVKAEVMDEDDEMEGTGLDSFPEPPTGSENYKSIFG